MAADLRALGTRRAGGAAFPVLLILVVGCSSARQAPLGPVVEADDLAHRLSQKAADRLVLLDVRDAASYERGHVAGAVHVEPEEWRQESLASETGLDHETFWRNRIGSLGVSGRDPVVIYDDGRMTEAARLWFIFQHFGMPDAAVLNGGYPALEPLIAAGRVTVSRDATLPGLAEFRPPAGATTRIGLVGRQEVREAVERGQAQIFDARTREEYAGLDLRRNLRGGHLPDAINVPHRELLDERGRLKPPETLAVLLEAAGFQRGQPVITHCDGGGRASLAALAAERAGYGPVLNYYLSFGDWAADATCPVIRPGP
jgi:thiosulfate/3-mercaptopyruvate sulfurtransferase